MTEPATHVHVRLFAAAAEVCGSHEVRVDADSAGQLRQRLAVLGPDASGVIAQCVLLRAGVRLEDHVALEGGETVDVLPPFAGG